MLSYRGVKDEQERLGLVGDGMEDKNNQHLVIWFLVSATELSRKRGGGKAKSFLTNNWSIIRILVIRSATVINKEMTKTHVDPVIR